MRFKLIAVAALMCAGQANAARYYEFELKGSAIVRFPTMNFVGRSDLYDVTLKFMFDTGIAGQVVPTPPSYWNANNLSDGVTMENILTPDPSVGGIFDLQTPDGPGFGFNFSFFDIPNSEVLSDLAISNRSFSYAKRVDPRYSITNTGYGQITSFTARTSDIAPGYNGLLQQIVITPVPEPGTWSMMILGVGMVGAGMRRRRKMVFA